MPSTDLTIELMIELATKMAAEAWPRRALCASSGERSRWFTCHEKETVNAAGVEVPGEEAHRLAVGHYCIKCPVQWECATWAVKHEEPHGVWAMVHRDLRWLRQPAPLNTLGVPWTKDDAVGLIDKAQEMGVPVQIAVGRLRTCLLSPTTPDPEPIGASLEGV